MANFRIRRAFPVGRLIVCLAAAGIVAAANAEPPPPRAFPVGGPNRLEDLPAGRFRNEVLQLPAASRGRALQWLRSFHFPGVDAASLRADADGGICYACTFPIPAGIGEVQPPAAAPEIGAAAVPVSPFPAHLVFHSRPGAPNVLYINVAGETVTNTEWNDVVDRPEIPALAFSTDADPATFSDTEQAAIRAIWQRIAEDYAPFAIDVTTERPAVFDTRTAMVLITRTADANGDPNPYITSAGVAYVNVFNTSNYAKYRPAWIYHDNLANLESYIAEAATHEIGHNLGLSHDGKTDGTEYYGGHGTGEIAWAPIMGTAYGRHVTQWSRGEYYLANNTEDDLATIAARLAYRADDHGNTAASATALTITGGTNIVSTTPANDPDNADPSNKGSLERSSDVDVFSFVTGPGPVTLSVNPWKMPSGTRGGNLDVLLELYNDAGARLATNNAPDKTGATVQTTLPEGRFFLHVRNAGAGDPFGATPSGYTAYGSLGQYFLSGVVTESAGFLVPPVAELEVADLTETGRTELGFAVTYADDIAVDVSTIDSGDIRVTGPNGYDQHALFVSVDVPGNGTPRRAVYAVTPPGGGDWSPAMNGSYTVWMRADEVADTEGASVTAQLLGQFQVAVPTVLYAAHMDADPGWALEPDWAYGVPAYAAGGPTGGFTGTHIVGYNLDGNYPNGLSVRYAVTPPIDASGTTALTLRFGRWLGLRNGDTAIIEASPDGVSWIGVWAASGAVADTGWQAVRYALPAAVTGSASLRLRWGLGSAGRGNSPTAIGWNLDDVEVLGDGALDAVPPAAVLRVMDVTSASPLGHACTVTYTDDTAVLLASLDAADLLVTGPNGYANLAAFIGADLPEDGSPLTGSYSIPPPTDEWDTADNGAYTITLQEGAVQDTAHNSTSELQLGTFFVEIPPPDPEVIDVDLRITTTQPAGDAAYILTWNPVTGRIHAVWFATHLPDAFSPLPGATNLPDSVSSLTNSLDTSSPPRQFFRLEATEP